MILRFSALLAALVAMIAATAGPAAAHPHVWVTVKSELVYAPDGTLKGVRHAWTFDDMFSTFATQGLEAKKKGEFTREELAPLAKVNVESLKEYDFFTYLTVDNKLQKFEPPKEYWLEPYNGQLTLFFTLPLKQPLKVGRSTTLEIFDEEYFVAFTFTDKDPIKLDGAPASCSTQFHKPKELDAQTMAVLAAIPVDQHDLPPDLVETASALANSFTIACP